VERWFCAATVEACVSYCFRCHLGQRMSSISFTPSYGHAAADQLVGVSRNDYQCNHVWSTTPIMVTNAPSSGQQWHRCWDCQHRHHPLLIFAK
jgi:hypothetical protein